MARDIIPMDRLFIIRVDSSDSDEELEDITLSNFVRLQIKFTINSVALTFVEGVIEKRCKRRSLIITEFWIIAEIEISRGIY